MNVYDWAENALKDIQLFKDVIEVTNSRGITLTRDVSRERRLALGLINSNSPLDLYDVARQYCPPGTIIDDYDEDQWKPLFLDKSKMAEVELTTQLLDERTGKGAKVLLDILQKRMNNWKDTDKKVEVKTNEGTEIIFTL